MKSRGGRPAILAESAAGDLPFRRAPANLPCIACGRFDRAHSFREPPRWPSRPGFLKRPPSRRATGAISFPDAAAAVNGDGHKPYVPAAETKMPEFTWRAVLVGSALGILFGASSLYLVLKVGMTVSASIPVAVLAITLFRGLSRLLPIRAPTILENNIMQTAGSAGESIAFGVGVTMPALMLIGFEMDLTRIMVVSILGGLLGILMMIPLRRAFIVKLHGKPGEEGKLLYPEGTACAQVLISGEKGGTSGKTVFFGFGIAFIHKFVTEGMNLLKTTVALPLKKFSAVAVLTGDMASELLGVGYIIGARTSAIMFAGAVLGSLVIAPTIYFFGEGVPGIVAPASKPIAQMSIDDIHGGYTRFIGAGCVAAAGIISMCRTLPMIIRSFTSGVGTLRDAQGRTILKKLRTEDDLPTSFVLVGCLLLLILLTAFMMTDVGLVGAILGSLLVLLFGFLFVTVSSRLTGEIGSSSNPISGMTVATLLMTCLIFLAVGRTSPQDAVLALSIGGVVCIAASNGGTTSQDLKTGFLVGGTPRWQQWAIIAGALTSAVVIGFTLLLFNSAGNVYSRRDLPNVNLKDRLSSPELKEKETYQGEVYHVWRPAGRAGDPTVLWLDARREVLPVLAAASAGPLMTLPALDVPPAARASTSWTTAARFASTSTRPSPASSSSATTGSRRNWPASTSRTTSET